jgi:glyoxylase-like metal-dependent hydrolase (beta-lactamase superfamily II)
MSIFLGGEEVALRHFGRCHTNGDTFVYLPTRKVLVTGDCFNTGNGQGLNPTGATTMGFYVDYSNGGSFVDWPRAADATLKLDWDVVVPGHAPLTNHAGFLKWRRTIDALGNRMRICSARAGRKQTLKRSSLNSAGRRRAHRSDPSSLCLRN